MKASGRRANNTGREPVFTPTRATNSKCTRVSGSKTSAQALESTSQRVRQKYLKERGLIIYRKDKELSI
jgi:hypothetical protein